MKRLIFGLSALTLLSVSPSAFAKSRVSVTDDLLRKVEDLDKVPALRVYLEKKLVIKRESGERSDADVDGQVVLSREDRVLEEIVGRKTKGQIVEMKGSNDFPNNGEYTSKAEAIQNIKRVYVTFDPACKSVDCAFEFTRPYTLKNDYNRYYEENQYTVSLKGNSYYLTEVPDNPNYKVKKAFRDNGIFSRPKEMGESRFNILADKKNRPIKLELKLKEYKKTIHETRRHRGID